jgi:hypothetical protein
VSLGAGLWQCSEETTGVRPGGIQLDLRRGAASVAIDSVEIEVWRGVSRVAAETLAVDSSGAFSWLLPLDAGGSYSVRAYARGVEAQGWPTEPPERGVVALATAPPIEVPAGRLAVARLDLDPAAPVLRGAMGEPGSDSIRVSWSPVATATAYRLGWYRARSGIVTHAAAIPDTQLTLAWDRTSAGALPEAESDSVLFRVRAILGTRQSVYGPGLWRDLGRWLDLPRVTGVTPLPGTTVEPDAFAIHLIFDRPMATGTVEEGVLWTRRPGGERVDYTLVSEDASHARLRLDPEPGVILMDAVYELRLTPQLADAQGRPFDADGARPGLQDTLFTWTTAPYAPLQVVAMEPRPGSNDAPLSPTVRVAFNRAIDPATLGAGRFWVHDAAGAPISGSLSVASTRDTIRWQPAAPFWYATACTVGVSSDLRDADGRALDQDAGTYPQREPFVAHFRTLDQPLGPRVVAIQPAAGAMGVSRDAMIEIEFSQPVDTVSVRTADSFRVLRDGQIGIPGSVRHDAEQRRFAFHASSRLQTGTTYQVQVNGDLSGRPGVTDLEGVPLDQDRAVPGFQPFRAAFRVERAPAVQSMTFEPARPDTFMPVPGVVRLRFTRPIDPASIENSAIVLTRGASVVPVTVEIAADSLVARLTPLDPLTRERRYGVRVDTLVATRDGSLLDQQPERPWHEPYRAFFTTAPESLHPRVILVAPAAGDTGAAVTDTIRVGFSIPIDPTTVTTGSFRLTRLTGGPQPVAATVTADSLTARLVASDSLAYAAEYEATVTTAVASRNGLFALDQDPSLPGLQAFTSRFRTAPERLAPWVQSSVPVDGATEVPIDQPIRITFSEPMDSPTVPAALSITQGDTPIGGVLTSTQAGRVWTFTPDAPLAWRSTYAARIDTLASDRAGNRLDQDPQAPGRQSFAITFVTQNEGTAPRVGAVTPEDGADGVGVRNEVRLVFSEPLAPGTITPENLRIVSGETPVPGSLTLAGADSIVSWIPIDPVDSTRVPLAFSTVYRVEAGTGIEDVWGNGLDQDPNLPERQPFASFFTTQPETLAPRVTALLPGSSDVPIDAQPRLVFSEPMAAGSLAIPGAVDLLEDGDPVPFTLALAPSADTLTLAPTQTLRPSQYYAVRVDTLARDRVGNALDQDPAETGAQPYVGVFLTEPDTRAPRVLEVTPSDGAQHAAPDAAVQAELSERVDPGTVHAGSVYLTGSGGIVALREGPALDDSGARIRLVPAAPFAEGETYGLLISHLVADLVGHPLDQDPDAPGAQDFASSFRVGRRPVVVWAGGLCALGDSTRVRFDASASFTPDTDDSLRLAFWDWGDGARDTLEAPSGLMATHDYGCQDLAGCDAVDNDGDGAADENGAGGCDESHRVILRLGDAYGVTRADTAGVAFCAFQVLDAWPASDDSVGMADTLRVILARAAVPAGLEEGIEFKRLGDPEPVAFGTLLRDGGRRLLIHPQYGFGPGEYRLRLTSGVRDALGVGLDQDPCRPGHQAFELNFHGPRRAPLPPPADRRETGPSGE